MRTILLSTLLWLQPLSAAAAFDVQAMYGRRWYEFTANGITTPVTATENGIAAHIDPLPGIPMAFGASVMMGDLRSADFFPAEYSEVHTTSPALEVLAWIPGIPFLEPFARLKVPVMSTLTLKGTLKETEGSTTREVDFSTTYGLSGWHLHAGVRYRALPVLRLVAEGGLGKEMARESRSVLDGERIDADTGKIAVTSKAFLLGVEIGL